MNHFYRSIGLQKPTYMNVVPPLVMMLALNPIITKEKHLAKCEVISSGKYNTYQIKKIVKKNSSSDQTTNCIITNLKRNEN